MKPSMNKPINHLKNGTTIKGKWHNRTYHLMKKLGEGAVGVVYLALDRNNKSVAIKLSKETSAIATEVNVLTSLQKVQGRQLGPSLLDVDDWEITSNNRYSFYVMEYLHGLDLLTFLRQKGSEWLSVLIIQLLDDLEFLHKAGWVFGDLKTENLIVTSKTTRLRWIDVGGTTQIGRAIKEYTEFFDRGYWGLGTRKAESSYDLFSVAMIMINVFYPKRFEKGSSPEKTLKLKINQHTELRKYRSILYKALFGGYTNAYEMKRELANLILSQPKQSKSFSNQVHIGNKTSQAKKSSSSWVESIGIATVTALFFLIYLLFYMI
jgi:serine/threonine protein kinase